MKVKKKFKDGAPCECPNCGGYGEFAGMEEDDHFYYEERACDTCETTWTNAYKYVDTVVDDHVVPTTEEIAKAMFGQLKK